MQRNLQSFSLSHALKIKLNKINNFFTKFSNTVLSNFNCLTGLVFLLSVALLAAINLQLLLVLGCGSVLLTCSLNLACILSALFTGLIYKILIHNCVHYNFVQI